MFSNSFFKFLAQKYLSIKNDQNSFLENFNIYFLDFEIISSKLHHLTLINLSLD